MATVGKDRIPTSLFDNTYATF